MIPCDSVKFLHYSMTPGSLPASLVAFRLLPLCWWAAQILNATEMHLERFSRRTQCKYFFSDISISTKPFCLDKLLGLCFNFLFFCSGEVGAGQFIKVLKLPSKLGRREQKISHLFEVLFLPYLPMHSVKNPVNICI